MMKFLKESESNKSFTHENIKSWVLKNTTYGKAKPKDIERRHKNTEKALKKHKVQVSVKENDLSDEIVDIMKEKLQEKNKCIIPQKAIPPISLKDLSKTRESGRGR